MRLAVVSDIHGNLPALQAVMADAGAVDGWLNLGDIVSGPLWPGETLDCLIESGWPTIAGNHERQLLNAPLDRMGASDRFARAGLSPAQCRWLTSLPPSLSPLPGLLCVHGSPRSDLECLLETVTPGGMRAAWSDEVKERLGAVSGQRLVLCGHTHIPRELTVDNITVLNPGSVGLQAYVHDEPFEHEVSNGTPQARYALVSAGHDGWHTELRAVDYDFERAAAKAAAEGFMDWAHALRTGRNLFSTQEGLRDTAG
jgi:predicted phosphodiesterase